MKKEQKIQKLRADLHRLESQLREALTKKSSGKQEINLSKIQRQITIKRAEIENEKT